MWLLIVVLGVAAAALLSVAGLAIIRRSHRIHRYLGQNDVAGIVFGAVGVLYGALLAFVVFAVWETYAAAEQAVTDEGAAIVAVYRDTQTFPEPEQQMAQQRLRTYLATVMAGEWASHGQLNAHSTSDLLNPVWEVYRSVPVATSLEEGRLLAAEERLHALELQRHMRHLSGESTLPAVFWVVLIAGGVLVVVFSYFLWDEKLGVRAVETALLSSLLASVLLLIFSLNQPFTGPIPVSQQPLQHALAQFDALDLPAP